MLILIVLLCYGTDVVVIAGGKKFLPLPSGVCKVLTSTVRMSVCDSASIYSFTHSLCKYGLSLTNNFARWPALPRPFLQDSHANIWDPRDKRLAACSMMNAHQECLTMTAFAHSILEANDSYRALCEFIRITRGTKTYPP